MRSSVETVDPTTIKVSVAVDPDELGPAIDRAIRRLANQVRVPGFRKGRAPRSVIEARLGREAVLAEAIEHEAIPEFYERALREHEVQPVGRGTVQAELDEAISDALESKEIAFSATVEVRPRLNLASYDDLEVSVAPLAVTEADIDAQVERLRERFAQLEVSEEPLQDGAYALLDLRAREGEEEIVALSGEDLLYEVGTGPVPELDAGLRGASKGDELEISAEIDAAALADPEDDEDEPEGTVTVVLNVVVKEVKAKVLPALDDDLAAQASEHDTLEELRADIRKGLEESAAGHRAAEVEAAVLEAYLGRMDVPLPDTLVREEAEYRTERFVSRLQQAGIALEAYLAGAESSLEQLQADLRAQAERAVRAQLVLEQLAEREQLLASEDEVDAEIDRQAVRSGQDPVTVREVFSGERRGIVRGDVLRSKALALLVAQAQIHDAVPAPPQDDTAEDDAAGDGELHDASEPHGDSVPPSAQAESPQTHEATADATARES